MRYNIIISCEHAGNDVPDVHKNLFHGAEQDLLSHQGWDPGAEGIAEFLAGQLHTTFFKMSLTRLLIEMNRSEDSPQLFSRYSSILSEAEKEKLKDEFYFPYRKKVEQAIEQSPKPVAHLSIHSFTPVLNGVERSVDIGLLFDPDRQLEVKYCENLMIQLKTQLPELKIAFNEPYKGTDDGFTTHLRKKFPGSDYLGIEIEVNQKLINPKEYGPVKRALADAIRNTIV